MIDLYQSHDDDANTPLEETLAAYAELIRQGKVRAIGASNYGAARLQQALDVSRAHGLPRYESLQPLYNLYDRAVFEDELEAVCVKNGLGVINFYALASGFLTGKYRSAADLEQEPARQGRGEVPRCARAAHPRGARPGRRALRQHAGAGRAGLADGAAGDHRADRQRDARWRSSTAWSPPPGCGSMPRRSKRWTAPARRDRHGLALPHRRRRVPRPIGVSAGDCRRGGPLQCRR